jgi:hypothetical protein
MAVELSDEEKAKFEEHLKELGYDDHAKKVIERLNSESKSQREAREKAEAEAKQLREAEEKRKAEKEKRKAEEAEAKKRAEDEKKSVDERIKQLEETFNRELTKREEASVKKQQEFLDELKARDAQILMEAVRSAAVKRGIIDEDLVSMLDVSRVPIERGRPDRSAIDELLDEHAKSKPHLYRTEEEQRTTTEERDERGRFTRPDPVRKKDDVDASKLDDKGFEALEERLRKGRV